MVSQTSRPAGSAPIPGLQTSAVGSVDLSPDEIQLLRCDVEAPGEADRFFKRYRSVVAVGRIVSVRISHAGVDGVALSMILHRTHMFCVICAFHVSICHPIQRRIEKDISIGGV